jgi:uncharacterized protein (TIGR03083 family)
VPDAPVIDLLEAIWGSTADACRGLVPTDWEKETDCPGWSVRDQLAHVIGTELMLLGQPSPPALAPVPAYVHNPLGEMNEAWIEERRTRSGEEVLAEFVAVTRRRTDELRAMSDEEWATPTPSPVGEVPYGDFMTVRAFDSWVHEQDLRRAVGRPGGRDGAGEALTLDRVSSGMGFVVGRKVKPPEGTSVVWEVAGALSRTVVVTIEGGRGVLSEVAPASPTTRLTLDAETFYRLGCGRVDGESVLAGSLVVLDGDEDLGRAVVCSMDFMV